MAAEAQRQGGRRSVQDSSPDDGRLAKRMREARLPIITLFVEKINLIITIVCTLGILTATETRRIQNKPRRQQKADSLFDCLLRKSTQDLNRFLEATKDKCPAIYNLFTDVPRPGEPIGPLSPEVALALVEDKYQKTWELLTESLCDPYPNICDFYRKLKVIFSKDIEITLVRSNDGFNILHEMVRQGKSSYMACLQYSGIWAKLYSDSIDSFNSIFGGDTPIQLAQRSSKFAIVETMEKINQIEMRLEPLEKTVRAGDVSGFLSLKTGPSSMKTKLVGENMTVLDWACASGSVAMVREVIKAEVEASFYRSDVLECFKICVILGHYQLLQLLHSYRPVGLNGPTIEGRTFVEKCAQNGDWDTLRTLERLGATLPPSLPALAASLDKVIILQNLTERRFDLNYQDKRKKSALHFAAEKHHIESVRLLLAGGANIRLTDKRKWTAFHSAANGGSVEVLRLLVDAAQAQNCLEPMLMSRDRYLGSERCFLVRGRDQDMSAWHYVEADRGLLDIFRKRTRAGSVDIALFGTVLRSGWGGDPSPTIVREEEAKYDMLNIPEDNPPDMLPAHLAILKDHPQAAIMLIELMSTHDQTDRFGHTLLHLAAMRGNMSIISALLDVGASRLTVDHKKRTPYDVAVANEHPDAAALLRPQVAYERTKTPKSGHLGNPSDSSARALSLQQDTLSTEAAVTMSSHVVSSSSYSSHVSSIKFTMEALRSSLLDAYNNLAPERIAESRRKGESERDYVLNLLRTLTGDVNDYIYDNLGTSHITTPTG